MKSTLTVERRENTAQNYFKNHKKQLDTALKLWYSSYNEITQTQASQQRGEKRNFMKIAEMDYGMVYPVSEVTNNKALYNKCPCCGRLIADHFTVTVAFAPEKGAQSYKACVGADCAPEDEIPDGADTLTLRVSGKNRASVAADLAWATKEMTRTIEVSDVAQRDPYSGRFIGYTATVTILVPEKVNCLGKLGKVAQRISAEPVKQSLDGGKTWTELDTTVYAKVFGCGKYQGKKAYGV